MTPTIGRLVQFRVSETEVRPALVVRVWSDEMVNLQVFLDGHNDAAWKRAGVDVPMFTFDERERGQAWKTSVHVGNGIGDWSWPVFNTTSTNATLTSTPPPNTTGGAS